MGHQESQWDGSVHGHVGSYENRAPWLARAIQDEKDEKVWGHMKGQGSVGDKAEMVGGPQWTKSLEDGRGSSVCCSGLGPGWAWWAGQV